MPFDPIAGAALLLSRSTLTIKIFKSVRLIHTAWGSSECNCEEFIQDLELFQKQVNDLFGMYELFSGYQQSQILASSIQVLNFFMDDPPRTRK